LSGNSFKATQSYRDHASVTIPSDGRRSTPSFPLKLHKILQQIEEDGHGDIMSWQPHGRCFIIRKTTEFNNSLLKKYFNISKASSFQRQINLYGYSRITQGQDKGGYYHELFLRGKPELAKQAAYITAANGALECLCGAQEADGRTLPQLRGQPPIHQCSASG